MTGTQRTEITGGERTEITVKRRETKKRWSAEILFKDL
jgi:hypothetical protein